MMVKRKVTPYAKKMVQLANRTCELKVIEVQTTSTPLLSSPLLSSSLLSSPLLPSLLPSPILFSPLLFSSLLSSSLILFSSSLFSPPLPSSPLLPSSLLSLSLLLSPLPGLSLNQPNVCTARAMYGVDVILSGDNKPLILEVQWAPDCAQAVVQNKYFRNEILGELYLEEFAKFRQLWFYISC
jgi:Tubulin-tyrosine ligase family